MSRALMPNLLTPKDLEPNWEWRERLPAWGHTSVDFERRIDHDRLRRYRSATALPGAPDATDVVARVRRYLADDLDTPKALAALDGWATDALSYGGHDGAAGATVAAAVDALLGVRL